MLVPRIEKVTFFEERNTFVCFQEIERNIKGLENSTIRKSMMIFRWCGDILYENRNNVCAGNHETPLPISCSSCSAVVPPTAEPSGGKRKRQSGLLVRRALASWRGRSWPEQPTRPRPTNRHRRPLTRPQYEKLFKVIMLRHTAIHMLASYCYL